MAGRSKNRAKRSPASLPRGIPNKKKQKTTASPFEHARTTNAAARTKHPVHNRIVPGAPKRQHENPSLPKGPNGQPPRGEQSSLARSINRRETHLRTSLKEATKSNEFVDRRIGESRRSDTDTMTEEEKMLRRVVRERTRRSRRAAKFSLEDGEEEALTHKGQTIDSSYSGVHRDASDVILSDDDDDPYGGDLDRVDTMLHFGGGKFDRANRDEQGAYGPSGGGGPEGSAKMGDAYRSRKDELDDLIRRKKFEKQERTKMKENQESTFENMDESFAELAELLTYRDKEKERRTKYEQRKAGTLGAEELEMEAWDKEMKEYQFARKIKATDRTKTPEEIAKEEAERLHELETKRLARMEGDFDDDDLSDVSDDEDKKKRRKGKPEKKKKKRGDNPDELDDSDDEVDKGDETEVRFTADGLLYVDKNGVSVGKVEKDGKDDAQMNDDDEEEEDEEDTPSESGEESDSDEGGNDIGGSEDEASANESCDSSDDESDDDEEKNGASSSLKKGTKVKANCRGEGKYEVGVITAVRKADDGAPIYDVTYDDGDFEEGVVLKYVRPVVVPKAKESKEPKEECAITKSNKVKAKKLKAKIRARSTIPFVFEVPTTLEALHDVIATHASTGADASLIVKRIHSTNSVRLNGKNRDKMQNFYDVLLRRFVAVGDAIFESGDGGPDLQRYEQLNSITQTLYAMAQDSPEAAGAVWGRRIGVFQKSLMKRLRDAEVTDLGDACSGGFSTWPSTGVLLLLRALPHIFPSTDRRHPVTTPAVVFLGQVLAQCPVKSVHDVVMGLFCSGLMLEYTGGAKRLAPEAISFLSGVLRLFADDIEDASANGPVPSLNAGCREPELSNLRKALRDLCIDGVVLEDCISIEKDRIQTGSTPFAVLSSTLHLIRHACSENPDREVFSEVMKALLCINAGKKDAGLPALIKSSIAFTAREVSDICAAEEERVPLMRRSGASAKELAVKSLAPRMEDPERYEFNSKDKGKSQLQAERDRHRREYKREHKSTIRELKLDAAFVEKERRRVKDTSDGKARAKRNKNFSWLEQEQASMNHQVRMGGGLLSGGGIGAAKQKAKSAKLGIKAGGKFRPHKGN